MHAPDVTPNDHTDCVPHPLRASQTYVSCQVDEDIAA